MRILHVTDCFPPRLGGIETQVETLIQQQMNRGHEIQVLTLTSGFEMPGVKRLSAHIERGALIRFGSRRGVKNAVLEFAPDLIHAHVGSGAWLGWAAVNVAQRENIPVVLTVHSIWGGLARLLYQNRLTKNTHLQVVAVSRQALRSLRLHESAHIIANGLDIDYPMAQIPKRKEITFITASRLVQRKRLLKLVEIFARIQSKYPSANIHLKIAGEGPMRSRIERKIQKRGVTNVELLGRLSRTDLHKEYAQSHAYIQLSKLEAFGLAAAEAQVHQLGVIGLKESGIADFVEHQIDGFLGSGDDEIEQFLEKVIHDPAILFNFSNNVDMRNKPYRWDLVLERYEDLYKQCVGEV
ncbi:MAG: glycosyltransferase family 4 protein [Candidatus Nanopelagicales bacterium]